MIGLTLTAIGTFLSEVAASFGKWEVLNKRENMYTYGFLNVFWVWVIFIVFVIFKGNFVFDPASIPLFVLAIVLEIAQLYSTLHAIVIADRSTLGFLMIGTLPLLLVVDIFLGYEISIINMFGISIIVLSLLILLINHGLNKKGIGYVLFSTFNAVATISIYKYLITHHNSVPAQQIIMCFFLLVFLFIMSKKKYRENPLKLIFKREYFAHSLSSGLGGVLMSVAYVFAPASIITSGKRAFAILWSVISGNKYFHEKHLLIKITSFVSIVVGIILLMV